MNGNERYCGRADHRSWDWRFAAAGYLDDDLRIDVEFDNMEKLAWSSIIEDYHWSDISDGTTCKDETYYAVTLIGGADDNVLLQNTHY